MDHRPTFVALALLALGSGLAGPVHAQEANGAGALRIFLDCQTFGCDDDYFRTEIDWVSWVRDREVAEVHVLVTSQPTGAGGQRFDLNFIGRGEFVDVADTLSVATAPAATDDDTRRLLARILAVGLSRYAAETSLLERIEVSVREPEGADSAGAAAMPVDDPWNFWVFRLGLNANSNGQSRSSFARFSANASASRVTEEWKITLRTNGSYRESRFELSDSTESRTLQRSYGADGMLVNSWGPHWSSGVSASGSSSTFSNVDLALRIAPAIEYNLFPYAESTRRQFTLRYSVGPRYIDYTEETVFRRLTDRLAEQELELEFSTNQPWGSINAGSSVSHFLGWEPGPGTPSELDTGGPRYRISLNGGLEVRLFQGLSLNLFGFYSRIKDQIGLRRGVATDEDILLRVRELETDYNYFASIGLSYTFGSIYNTVVNPRFEGGGGTIIFF
ncbi:MAG: hypothetical protein ACRELV_01395 [Longimicrobiales bacterium]